ncbi:MAG: DUF1841 family protein [Pseudomonadota bacterium]
MFNPSREQVRHFFCSTWHKYRQKIALEGAETAALELILAHPEYHALLEQPELALQQEFSPEAGRINPFLHLSLHLAISEQLSIDQPPGIRAAYTQLCARLDEHDAQHVLLERLGELVWQAQRSGQGLDAEAYLDSIKRSQ